MVLILKSLIVVALGVALGLASVSWTLHRNLRFGAVRAGAWIVYPKAGSPDADPYLRAERARDGEVPLGVAEGLTFYARGDDTGAPLQSRCDLLVGGATPPARFWTLTALTPRGRLIETKLGRHGLTSSELTRDPDGGFSIDVASQARPGNWLPVAPDRPFMLMLRIYDTPLGSTSNAIDESLTPSLRRGRCE